MHRQVAFLLVPLVLYSVPSFTFEPEDEHCTRPKSLLQVRILRRNESQSHRRIRIREEQILKKIRKAAQASKQRIQSAAHTSGEKIHKVVDASEKKVKKAVRTSEREVVERSWIPAAAIALCTIVIGVCVIARIWSEQTVELSDNLVETDAGPSLANGFANFRPDVYALSVTSLIRDSYMNANGHQGVGRVMQSFLLVAIIFCIQVYLIWGVAQWAPSRDHLQHIYDLFELHMYEDYDISESGHPIGKRGTFDMQKFESFSEKEAVCRIPFSQPIFCLLALLVWTMTCLAECKAAAELTVSILVRTPRAVSMESALEPEISEQKGSSLDRRCNQLVVCLTREIKAAIACFILFPRIAITLAMLWLGSRWLTAAVDLLEVIVNCVALEFVLRMKDLLYAALVPAWEKHEVHHMKICPSRFSDPPDFVSFIGTTVMMFIAMAWVIIYMYYLQSNLVGFNWDVNTVCTAWVLSHYKIDTD